MLPARGQRLPARRACGSPATHVVSPRRKALVAVLLFACVVQPAFALPIPITVNSPADIINGNDGFCTLREALLSAATPGTPSGPAAGECGSSNGDTEIVFATSEAFPINAVITLSNANGALPGIGNKVLITGPITIDAGGIGGSGIALTVAANATLTATGLSILGAPVTALVNNGSLELGAGEFAANGGGTGDGAAIRNSGTAFVAGTRFVGSYGANGGAILTSGSLTVAGARFDSNRAVSAGGAIFRSAGTLEVTDTVFVGNFAGTTGGAMQIAGAVAGASKLWRNRYDGNQAVGSGGALFNASSVAVDVQDSSFVFNQAGTVAANAAGGAIYNTGVLSILRSVLSGNDATGDGGAIANEGSGQLSLTNVDIVGNIATQNGGGIVSSNALAGVASINASAVAIDGNIAGNLGGGVFNFDSAGDPFNIRASVIGAGNRNLPSDCRDQSSADDAARPVLNSQGDNLFSPDNSTPPLCVLLQGSDQTADVAQYGNQALNAGSSIPWMVTRKPLPGAAVLDNVAAANWPAGSVLATDVRGRARPQLATVAGAPTPFDTGPYELEPASPRAAVEPLRGSTIQVGAPLTGQTMTRPSALVIGNSGDAPLALSGYLLQGAHPGNFAVPTPPPNVAAGSVAAIAISCTPSAIGLRTATLAITTNDTRAGWSTLSYSLECEGLTVGSPRFASVPVAPGPVNKSTTAGTAVALAIAVHNTGSATLTLSGPSYSGSPDLNIDSVLPINIPKDGAPASIQGTCLAATPGIKSGRLTFGTNDPSTPTVSFDLVCDVRAAGSPVFNSTFSNTAGLGPSSGAYGIAVSPDGRHAYVTDTSNGRIAVYAATDVAGASKPLVLLSAQTSAARAADEKFDTPEQVAVSPDGRNVYATGVTSDSVATFSRNQNTGELTWIDTVKNGAGYNCPGGVCASTISSLDGAYGIALSADGRFVYVSSKFADSVTVFARNPANGSLSAAGGLGEANFVQAYTDTLLSDTWGLALSPDGANLYVTSYATDTLVVLDRGADDGKLTTRQILTRNLGPNGFPLPGTVPVPGPGLDGVFRVIVAPDGRFVYTASYIGDSVCLFRRAALDGTLTFDSCLTNPPITGLNAASDLVLSPDGRRLFVTGYLANSVNAFAVDQDTGTLSFEAVKVKGMDGFPLLAGARGVQVARDGGHVYVAAQTDKAVVSLPVMPPLPVIAGLVPAAKLLNDSDLQLVVRGTGFTASSVVRVGGADRVTVFVSAQQLVSQLTPADVSTLAVRAVTVFNAAGTSLPANLAVVANAAALTPSLSSLAPVSAVVGGGPLMVTIRGRDFKVTSRALWNGEPRTTTFVSATELQMALPTSDLLHPGFSPVAVEDTVSGALSPAPLLFFVAGLQASPTPYLVALSPSGADPLGNAATIPVTITGGNFTPNGQAFWNGQARPIEYVDAGTVRILLSGADVFDGRPAAITVREPGPAGWSNALIFNDPFRPPSVPNDTCVGIADGIFCDGFELLE